MTEVIVTLCGLYSSVWFTSANGLKATIGKKSYFHSTWHVIIVFDDIHLTVMALKSQLALMNIDEGL